MHKPVILLTKAVDEAEAKQNAQAFLERYGDGDVWDRYQIGGRRTSTLAPNVDKFYKFAEERMKNESGLGFSSKEIEDNKHELQAEWELMGMEGPNPYADHYSLGIDGGVYDIMPLKKCKKVVKARLGDLEKSAEENWSKAVKERKETNRKKSMGEKVSRRGDMSGYYAKRYAEAHYGEFCFDTNVYDIDTDEAETMPKDIEGYRAVMVDMHN